MKILIVGAGVAGCAFAAFAKKYNLGEVVLVERAPEFRNIGFVIGLWGNGRRVLRELDLDKHIIDKKGYEVTWNAFEDMHAKLLKVWSFHPLRKLGITSVISRSDLHAGLIGALEGASIRFGTTVTAIGQKKDQVEVTFSDDKQENFDLVVGADGIKSSIRHLVFGPGLEKYYNWGVWVYWLPESFQHSSQIITEIDQGKLCSVFPLYERSVVWFVAPVPVGTGRNTETRLEILREQFKGFAGRVPQILALAPKAEEVFYDDLAHVDMPLWHKGSVVLIGDAQHAASPISGMGASMALEDAFVLAEELKTNNDVHSALHNFTERRKHRIKEYHRITERGDRWILAKGVLGRLRDFLLPFIPFSYFVKPARNLLEEDI